MSYKMPWSNFHELNLDWLLEETKQLRTDVDGMMGASTPSDDPPEMDGIADPGLSVNYARGDHRHPTDTTRAADADLAQEILDRGAADIILQNSINTVDAKIVLSNTAPLMDDSSATAGVSTQMSRADHVHPTDTSRASKSEFDTLKATVDGMSGSSMPSDATPQMDGVGAAGTGGNYSRGDHVHPSDTSKLDTAGGTITGNLAVNGVLTIPKREISSTITAPGWLRVAVVPNTPGTRIDFTITRKGDLVPAETHKITLAINQTAILFVDENSASDSNVNYIDKIRFSNAGFVDIHSDQSYLSYYTVHAEVTASSQSDVAAIEMQSPIAVADAPVGETLTTYTFKANTTVTGNITFETGFTGARIVVKQSGNIVHVSFVLQGTISLDTDTAVATITGVDYPSDTLRFMSGCGDLAARANKGAVITINTDGTVHIQASAACTVALVTITYIV